MSNEPSRVSEVSAEDGPSGVGAASESNPTPRRRASDYWNFCKCGHDGAVHDCLTNRCMACDCARFRQVRTAPTPANEPSDSTPHAAGRTTHEHRREGHER